MWHQLTCTPSCQTHMECICRQYVQTIIARAVSSLRWAQKDKAGQGRIGRSRTVEHWHGSGDDWRRVRRLLHGRREWTSSNVGKCYPDLMSRKPVTRMGMLYPLRMDSSIWSAQIDGYSHYDHRNIAFVIILSRGRRTGQSTPVWTSSDLRSLLQYPGRIRSTETPWTHRFLLATRMLRQRVTCRTLQSTYFMMNGVVLMRGAPELPDIGGELIDTCSVR